MALAGWSADKKITLTLDSSVIPADLTGFPLAVKLSSACGKTAADMTAVFAELGANSLKIAVEIAGSGAQTYVEIELWDHSAGVALLHIACPSLSSAVDPVFNLYYDSAQADNSTYVGLLGSAVAANVWPAQYDAVYHSSQDITGAAILDSTGNNHDISAIGGTWDVGDNVEVSGFIARGWNFEAAALNYLGLPSSLVLADNPAVELISSCNAGGYITIFEQRNNVTGGGKFFTVKDKYLGTYASTAVAYNTGGTPAHLLGTKIGSAYEIFDDGVSVSSGTVSSQSSLTPTIMDATIGSRRTDAGAPTDYCNGVLAAIRIYNTPPSAAWVATCFYSAADALVTYTTASDLVRSYLVQRYGAGDVRGELSQIYGAKLGSELEQQYTIFAQKYSILAQVYGLKLLSQLRQPYANAATPQSVLVNWYGDTAEIQASLVQRYGDALAVQSVLEQMYTLPEALQSVLVQRYGITGTEVKAVLEQMYNLHGYDLARSILVQPWMIAAAESLKTAMAATITIGGAEWSGYHINVEGGESSYYMTCELKTAEQAMYLQVSRGDAIVITIASTDYHFICTAARRSRVPGKADYIIEGASRAVLLDTPHARPLRRQFEPGMASEIAIALAAGYGVTLTWDMVDWSVAANALHANDETALQVIRKLVNAAGGILQSAPDGTLTAQPLYRVSPTPTYSGRDNWDTVAASATLTDQDNFFTADESYDQREGHNRFLISNLLASTARDRLDEVEISATQKLLRAYIVPWSDRAGAALQTSRDNVTIEPETVTDATRLIEDEQVEFVNGSGQARYPVYEVVSLSWQDTSLGAITYGEDGGLQAEVAGQSLLLISYRTNFLQWRATDPRIEDVQFYLERAA